MKRKILALLATILFLLLPATAEAQVYPQQTYNNQGQLFFRVINNTNYYYSCYYHEQATNRYFTFSIPPYQPSMWYPVYAQYTWYCS